MTNTIEQVTLFGEVVESTGTMKISLNIKRPSEFFWVRKIRGVDISQCCAKCFIGESDTRMYHATTNGQTPRSVEMEVKPGAQYVAYYLCGLSKNYFYQNNTHVAFVYAPGEMLRVETSQIELTISNARQVDFQKYVPKPEGVYNQRQRTCRNWIFANYIRDGLLQQK